MHTHFSLHCGNACSPQTWIFELVHIQCEGAEEAEGGVVVGTALGSHARVAELDEVGGGDAQGENWNPQS